MSDQADAGYRRKFVELMNETGVPLDMVKFDAFFEMHEEGTSSVVLACMMVLAMKEGDPPDPYEYWLQYDEDRFTRLADLTMYMCDYPDANPEQLPWSEVTIHGVKFSDYYKRIEH